MPLNLNRDKLRGELRGGIAPATQSKPPTTSQRIERLKLVLLDYYTSHIDIDRVVMSIVMTSMPEDIIRHILDEEFREEDGQSWRKLETLYEITKDAKLAVAAYNARLSYAEINSLIKSGKASAETIVLMSKLQKRAENSDMIQREKQLRSKPSLSSSGLRAGIGRQPKRRQKR